MSTMHNHANRASPTISIGMPIHNGAWCMRPAIDSVLAQVRGDFELVISDNASTDETGAIAREYAERDSRIRYLRQPTNIGPSANFRQVLEQATAPYFAWLAADDRWEPGFLQALVPVLEADPDVGLVFSDYRVRNLLTGHEERAGTGFSASRRPLVRYLFRSIHGCACLVYGVHRREIVSRCPLGQFDFADVWMTHWYELNSRIRVVPMSLFVAGTRGDRQAYSLSGSRISPRRFLRAEWRLLRAHFSWPTCIAIIAVMTLLMYMWCLRLNSPRKDQSPNP